MTENKKVISQYKGRLTPQQAAACRAPNGALGVCSPLRSKRLLARHHRPRTAWATEAAFCISTLAR
jgi:hypothetical protein